MPIDLAPHLSSLPDSTLPPALEWLTSLDHLSLTRFLLSLHSAPQPGSFTVNSFPLLPALCSPGVPSPSLISPHSADGCCLSFVRLDMPSSASAVTRRRFHLPNVPSDLTPEGVRLFLDSLERRQQQLAHPMLASFLKTLRGYSTHDVSEAERCAEEFITQLNAREERKAMHAVSTTLSSLHRPAQPPQTGEELWLFRLPVDTLHYLLSFIPSFEFFLRLPFLSHSLKHLHTHPDLHRQYGQQRFDVSASQWRAYSSQSWPQLSVPVWRYGYYQADDEMKQAVERAEARERRQQKRIARRYIRANARPHNTIHSNRKQPTTANLDNLTCLMAQRREEDKEQHEAASKQRRETKKDWALEATHLFQHLHFASIDLLRFAPQLTSTGVRLHYRLPRYIIASIIDALTTCRMEPLFALERRCRPEGKVITHRLFLPRYESFLTRPTQTADVAVELPPRVVVSAGVGLDEEEVESMREALPTDVSEAAGDEVKAEVEEWQITEATQQWLDELEMEEEDDEEEDEEGLDLRMLERRYRGLPSRLSHILPLAYATDQYDNPVMLDCLFFSSLLQQTLRTAATAAATSATASSSSPSSLLIDLTQCPVARFELCDDGWGPHRATFGSADAWAAAGGMDWMCKEPPVLDDKWYKTHTWNTLVRTQHTSTHVLTSVPGCPWIVRFLVRRKRIRVRHDWLGWTAPDSSATEHKAGNLGEEKEGKGGKEERKEEGKAQNTLDSRRRRWEERKMYEYEVEEEEEEAEAEEDDGSEEEEEEDEEDEDENGRDGDEDDEDEAEYDDIPAPLSLRAAHAAFMSYLLRSTDQPSQWVFGHAHWETEGTEAAPSTDGSEDSK